MSFKLIPNPTFKATVNLTVPGQENPGQIEFEFRHMTSDGLKAWFEDGREKTSAEALSEVIVGWNGVLNTDDNPLPFSAERLAELLANYPASGMEALSAYVNRLTESRAKN